MGKLLVREDDYSVNFTNYWHDNRLKKHRDELNEQKYPVNFTDATYRQINGWVEAGILPDSLNAGGVGWKKFSLVGLAWIIIINELRAFGLSLAKIKIIKEQILKTKKSSNHYADFQFYLSSAYLPKADPYIVVLADGTADIGTAEGIELSKITGTLGEGGYLLIPLKAVIKRLKFKVKLESPLWSLSDKEELILKDIRKGSKGKKEFEFEVSTFGEIRNKKVKEVYATKEDYERALLRKEKEGFYGKAESNYEKGNEQSFSITESERRKK